MPPITAEEAEELIKARPDIPKDLVDAARAISPGMLAVLAKGYQTQEEHQASQSEQQRVLRLKAVRDVAERARAVQQALEGAWGDATRLEVFNAVHEHQADVALLAEWFTIDDRREGVPPSYWRKVRTVGETQKVRAAVFYAYRLIEQASRQDKRPPKLKRKRPVTGARKARR